MSSGARRSIGLPLIWSGECDGFRRAVLGGLCLQRILRNQVFENLRTKLQAGPGLEQQVEFKSLGLMCYCRESVAANP
jgi:hypothetical protein